MKKRLEIKQDLLEAKLTKKQLNELLDWANEEISEWLRFRKIINHKLNGITKKTGGRKPL